MSASGCQSENLEFVDYLTRKLPEICVVKDLVQAGIYSSAQAAYSARRDGIGPKCIRIPCRGFVYPKKCVIDFIRSLR